MLNNLSLRTSAHTGVAIRSLNETASVLRCGKGMRIAASPPVGGSSQ